MNAFIYLSANSMLLHTSIDGFIDLEHSFKTISKGKLRIIITRLDSTNARIDEPAKSITSKIRSARNELKIDISKVDLRVEDLGSNRLDLVRRFTILEA